MLKNTKNMTPNSSSVRPEKFHPYGDGISEPSRQRSPKSLRNLIPGTICWGNFCFGNLGNTVSMIMTPCQWIFCYMIWVSIGRKRKNPSRLVAGEGCAIIWYCMLWHGVELYYLTLYDIEVYCIVWYGIAWYWVLLNVIVCYWMVLPHMECYCIIFNGIA